MSCIPSHKRVLVSGFGPFSSNGVDISVNASGEAVKLLNQEELESKLNISLELLEVPVDYEHIDNQIPNKWNEFQSHLTIHVGLSDIKTKALILEQRARKTGYAYKDAHGKTPDGEENPSYGPIELTTDMCIESICEKFNRNRSDDEFRAVISDDAGLFVCEYIYYTSLCQQMDTRKTTLFVHVPYRTETKEFEELAEELERLIEICVDDVKHMTNAWRLAVSKICC